MVVVFLKWVSSGLALVPVLAAVSALADEKPQTIEVRAVVDAPEGAEAEDVMVYFSTDEEATSEPIVVRKIIQHSGDGDAEAGADGQFIMVSADAAAGASPMAFVTAFGTAEVGGAWLGVQLAEVPPPVAEQLRLGDKGIMVGNLVEDSPADQAGLQRWDVIVALNGADVTNDVSAFTKKISEIGEGKKLDLTVVRAGAEVKVNPTLAARPESKSMKWKHEPAQDMAWRQKVINRVKAIEKGPDGTWVQRDLGDLDELKDLPPDILHLAPGGEGISTRIEIEHGDRTVNTTVERDGTTIEVEQEGEGDILVRRTNADGSTTEQLYKDAEALRDGDAEAAEIFEGVGHGGEFSIELHDLHDLHGLDGLDNLKNFKFELQGLGEHGEEVRKALDEARESFKDAMKDIPQNFRFHMLGPHFQHRLHGGEDGDEEAVAGAWLEEDIAQTFKVIPGGSIEVRYVKNGSELIEVYKNEEDLAARNPEMFEKFQDIKGPATR